MIDRRGFIGALTALIAAPWVKVKAKARLLFDPAGVRFAKKAFGPPIYAYYTFVNTRTGEETLPMVTAQLPPMGSVRRAYHFNSREYRFEKVPSHLKVEP